MDGLAPDFVPDRYIIYLPPQGYHPLMDRPARPTEFILN